MLQVKGTVEDLTKSAQKEEGTTSPSGAGTNADTAAGETSGKEQAQGTPTEDRQKFESANPGTDEGPSGAQGQDHSGGAAGSQTAGAAGSTGSLMNRLRSAAEVVRREVRAHLPDLEPGAFAAVLKGVPSCASDDVPMCTKGRIGLACNNGT